MSQKRPWSEADRARCEQVTQVVAKHFNLKPEHLDRSWKPERIAWPRQIIMYLLRWTDGWQLQRVADAMGKKEHRTVWHACHRVEDRMETEPAVKQMVKEFERILES